MHLCTLTGQARPLLHMVLHRMVLRSLRSCLTGGIHTSGILVSVLWHSAYIIAVWASSSCHRAAYHFTRSLGITKFLEDLICITTISRLVTFLLMVVLANAAHNEMGKRQVAKSGVGSSDNSASLPAKLLSGSELKHIEVSSKCHHILQAINKCSAKLTISCCPLARL